MRAYTVGPLRGLLILAGLVSWVRQHEKRKLETGRMLDKVFEARIRQSNDHSCSLTSEAQASKLFS